MNIALQTPTLLVIFHLFNDSLRRRIAGWRRLRQAHATIRALGALDDRGLRDLGFDRSEVLSIAVDANDGTRARSATMRMPGAQ